MTVATEQYSAQIVEAANWLAAQPMWPSPIVPSLKATHGLGPKDSIAAIRVARQIIEGTAR